MTQVNIHEAKTQLTRLLARVQAGEEVVITRAGKPVARLAAVESSPEERIPGRGKDEFVVRENLFKPLPDELLGLFES